MWAVPVRPGSSHSHSCTSTRRAFSPPAYSLTAVPGTALLLSASSPGVFLEDSSGNGVVIANAGEAEYSADFPSTVACSAFSVSASPSPPAYPPGSSLGVDVVGSNMRSFVTSDPFSCYAECSTSIGCVSWAWGLPDASCAGDYPNTCFLKSASEPLTSKPCRLWGKRAVLPGTGSDSANASVVSAIAGVVILAIIIGSIIACICCCVPACRRRCAACLRCLPPLPPALVNFPLSTGTVPPWLPFAPDSALRWELVRDGKFPPDLAPFQIYVGTDGRPEYLARARLTDGSLRVGRVSRSPPFQYGCRIACECAPPSCSMGGCPQRARGSDMWPDFVLAPLQTPRTTCP